MIFLDSFMSVPSFRNTCRYKRAAFRKTPAVWDRGSGELEYDLWDSPCPAERSHGGRWVRTECAWASESYPVKHPRREERDTREAEVDTTIKGGLRSHPLFHDVIGVVGHFFHDAQGSCTESGDTTLVCGANGHPGGHWTWECCPWSDLGCLYSPQSPLEGSSDSLEKKLQFIFFATKEKKEERRLPAANVQEQTHF